MTLSDRALGGPAVEAAAPTSVNVPRPLAFAVAALVSFLLSWPHLLAVWQTGTFFDTDDAMRMVQVRDWLAGQGWFDLCEARIDPPHGLIMHWSRVIDLPLALLVRVFGAMASGPKAELLARIAFPLGCQLLLIVAFVRAAEALCGAPASLPAAVLIALSGAQYGQFTPGRIDHHAPQIVLLIATLAAFVASIRTGGRGSASLCALFMALSLGISLENLPFIGVLIAGLVAIWIIGGDRMAVVTSTFGTSLAAAVAGVFIATVAPSRWLAVTPDAMSAGHVGLLAIGGAGLALLTRSSFSRSTRARRLGGAAALGGVLFAFIALACPGLTAGPYGAIDPVVRAVWLDHVAEALPLRTVLALHPQAATLIVAPVLLGLIAALHAARKGDPVWCVIVALIMTGIAGTCWQIRVASTLVPVALLGSAYVAARCASGLSASAPVVTAGCAFAFTPVAWALVPVPEEAPAVRQAAQDAEACRATAALTPLIGLAPGLAFAPIDIGSHLLAHTGLSVIAVPYHRNNVGNRVVIDGFLAPPEQAASLVPATGARYVVICPGEVQMAVLAEKAPGGLAARLLEGATPPWLSPVALGATPYRVFAVSP